MVVEVKNLESTVKEKRFYNFIYILVF